MNDCKIVQDGMWEDEIPWFYETELSYFQLPKTLFTNRMYRELSLRAKVCYALLLERAKLSYSNGWRDCNGEIYVYYSLKNLAEILDCTESSCAKAYRELENAKLCKRKLQGQGRPARVVVCPVIEPFNLRLKNAK
jgi:DNA-binding transcriptional regulator GbsR (MarR family)